MRVKILRVALGNDSTLSHLYIDGIFQCYLLEDKIRAEKIPNQTAFPEGIYKLRLNTWGGMNSKYKGILGVDHVGMIEIAGIPNYSYVYIHIGNTHLQTSGCPLTGFGFESYKGNYKVLQSRLAYEMVYPKLAAIAQSTDNQIEVTHAYQF